MLQFLLRTDSGTEVWNAKPESLQAQPDFVLLLGASVSPTWDWMHILISESARSADEGIMVVDPWTQLNMDISHSSDTFYKFHLRTISFPVSLSNVTLRTLPVLWSYICSSRMLLYKTRYFRVYEVKGGTFDFWRLFYKLQSETIQVAPEIWDR